MFTGIVEELGTVASISSNGMTVRAEKVMSDLKLGDSISVNGACLTAVSLTGSEFSVDLSPETMRRTSLGDLSEGGPSIWNAPFPPVTGWADTLCRVMWTAPAESRSTRDDGDSVIYRVRVPARLMPYIVEKGVHRS